MISEFFLNIVFNIVTKLLDMLPDVVLSPDTSVFGYFVAIIKVACYMLPMDTVGKICGLIVSFTIVRATVSRSLRRSLAVDPASAGSFGSPLFLFGGRFYEMDTNRSRPGLPAPGVLPGF